MKVTTSGGQDIHFNHAQALTPTGKEGFDIEPLLQEEGLTIEAFLRSNGQGGAVFGGKVFEEFFSRKVVRKGSSSYVKKVQIGDVTIRAQEGQVRYKPERPRGYRYPVQGKAGAAVARIARAFKYGRSIYLYGPAGTGKSDLFRALAHDTNKEFALYPMNEQMDSALYLGKEKIVIDEATGLNVTKYEPGKMLQDIQGRVGLDGIRRPVVIVIDDIDKAPAEHHEIFRHLLDNAQEIFIPEMAMSIPVYPGTQFIATANSRGRGDDTGFYSGIQNEGIDDSILDRFHRFVEYDFMEPSEEILILQGKFPNLATSHPEALSQIMRVCRDLRHMIKNREVFFNFSHRRLEDWCQSVEELIEERGSYSGKVLGEAANDWLDRYDEDTKATLIERVLRAHIAM